MRYKIILFNATKIIHKVKLIGSKLFHANFIKPSYRNRTKVARRSIQTSKTKSLIIIPGSDFKGNPNKQ